MTNFTFDGFEYAVKRDAGGMIKVYAQLENDLCFIGNGIEREAGLIDSAIAVIVCKEEEENLFDDEDFM